MHEFCMHQQLLYLALSFEAFDVFLCFQTHIEHLLKHTFYMFSLIWGRNLNMPFKKLGIVH
jgi:hypothetical protein